MLDLQVYDAVLADPLQVVPKLVTWHLKAECPTHTRHFSIPQPVGANYQRTVYEALDGLYLPVGNYRIYRNFYAENPLADRARVEWSDEGITFSVMYRAIAKHEPGWWDDRRELEEKHREGSNR